MGRIAAGRRAGGGAGTGDITQSQSRPVAGPPLRLHHCASPSSTRLDGTNERTPHRGLDIPKSIMHHWMKKLQLEFEFECGEKKLSGLTANDCAAIIRRYIFDNAVMLQLEASGKYVRLWLDESSIHTG